MKKVIISLYVIMNITYCTSDTLTGKNVDTFKMDVPASLFYALIYTRERYSETRVIDMKDGTLKVAKYDIVTGIFGQGIDKEYELKSYLVKKCVQGQVYRPVENDCRGKGTQDNWWGAEKYQWCNIGYDECVNDLTKSPANATCLNDTVGGHSWEPYILEEIFIKFIIKNLLIDIPNGLEAYYWWNYVSKNSDNKERVYSMHNPSDYRKVDINTYNYVVCSNQYTKRSLK